MREIRNLKKEIEQQFSIENGLLLAEHLCSLGIYELSEEHKRIIAYLQDVCYDFSFEHDSLGYLLSENSYEDCVRKMEQYTAYTGEDSCSLESLSISDEYMEECKQYFAEEEFDEEESLHTLAAIMKMGQVAKCMEEIREATDLFSLFGISKEKRNFFISENADVIYNSFCKNIESNFMELIEKYGKEEGFQILIQYPLAIRLGVEIYEEDDMLQMELEKKREDMLESLRENEEKKRLIEELFEKMHSREQMVIRYRFGLDDGEVKTLEKTAEAFGVSKERVRQIEAKALRRVVRPVRRRRPWKDYLD